MPEPLGLAGVNSRVMQWLVLSRDSLQGLKVLSLDPTNQLPTSLIGQATRPPGGSTAHHELLKGSTCYPLLQAANLLTEFIPLQLVENSNAMA
jgi:hypothetical protein